MNRMYYFIHKDQNGETHTEQCPIYGPIENKWIKIVNEKLANKESISPSEITPIIEGYIPTGYMLDLIDGQIKVDPNVKPRRL